MTRLTTKDHAAITQLWTTYRNAFDRKDARAAANVYASEGDLESVDGTLATGPAAIKKLYKQLFSQFPTASLRNVKIAPARGATRDVALVSGGWRVVGVGPRAVPVRATLVVRRQRGVWRYVAVRFMTPA